jgi:uncharacterized protein (TIGR00255 family)
MTAIQDIQALTNIPGSVGLDTLLQLPNVFVVSEAEINENTARTIMTTVAELLQVVVSMRMQEGAALQKDLEGRIAIMATEIDAIAVQAHEMIDTQKAKINEAIQALKMDETQFAHAQKDALFAMLDKIDLHEEIVRFKIKSLSGYLTTQSAEHGKRIDFTLQELAREINTIAAKCSSAPISERAINIKVEIEKAREQAQNIL